MNEQIKSTKKIWWLLCQRDHPYAASSLRHLTSDTYCALHIVRLNATTESPKAVQFAEENSQQIAEQARCMKDRKAKVDAQLSTVEAELAQVKRTLAVLISPQDEDSPIPLAKENIFYDVARVKLAQTKTKIVEARPQRGKPLSVIKSFLIYTMFLVSYSDRKA